MGFRLCGVGSRVQRARSAVYNGPIGASQAQEGSKGPCRRVHNGFIIWVVL